MIKPNEIHKINIGDQFYYQGPNTMTKNAKYIATVQAIYKHHIVVTLRLPESKLENLVLFTDPEEYTWSIAKKDIGRSEIFLSRVA